MRHDPHDDGSLSGPTSADAGILFSESGASLDRQDLTVEPLQPTLAVTWRHSGWHRLRSVTFDALTAASGSRSRLERFAACGASAWVAHAEGNPTQLRIIADYCHDRFCKPCAAARARRLENALVAHVAGKRVRLVTLTLRSSTDPLKHQVKRLQLCFRRLRQRNIWKTRVKGGLATIEITRNHVNGKWHPHLHVVATGGFIPQAELARNWEAVTGDSSIVDVRDLGTNEATCRYVAKYTSKGIPSSIMYDRELAIQVVAALTGTRTFTCFGDWHGFAVTTSRSDTTWIKIAPLDAVIAAAHRGDVRAENLLELLRPKNFEQNSTQPPSPCARAP